jgi:hypothetical protein
LRHGERFQVLEWGLLGRQLRKPPAQAPSNINGPRLVVMLAIRITTSY